MKPVRRLAAICAAIVVASVASGTAHADIYGYIDAGGVTHLATEKLDDQYTLFLKSGERAPSPPATGSTSAPGPTDPLLMKTRLFQRLVDHPNIAKYEPLIRAAAARHALDPDLVKAVIAVESGFDAGAVSGKGAVGLMQILPATGERYGVRGDARKSVDAKLTDPRLNLEIGTRYLADLRKQFARPELALAAYNAGENAVVRYRNAIPPYPETIAYVKLVDQFHAFYNPTRDVAKARPTLDGERLRVTIPARRNLPDPNRPYRLPPPADGPSAASVEPSIAIDGVAAPR